MAAGNQQQPGLRVLCVPFPRWCGRPHCGCQRRRNMVHYCLYRSMLNVVLKKICYTIGIFFIVTSSLPLYLLVSVCFYAHRRQLIAFNDHSFTHSRTLVQLLSHSFYIPGASLKTGSSFLASMGATRATQAITFASCKKK